MAARKSESRPPRIGIALGAGSARGWAHIGVLRALEARGIHPQLVAGTSIGALVGAAYAGGKLEELHAWVRELTWQQVVGFLDPSFASGLIGARKLFEFFRGHFGDPRFGDLARPLGVVAADLQSGHEVWLQQGSVLDAVRASVALPGVITPVERDGRWLLDGGLVNPVPVSLCRAMGAEVVIAVDLNADLLHKHRITRPDTAAGSDRASGREEERLDLGAFLRQGLSRFGVGFGDEAREPEAPSLLDIVMRSANIMQMRITRSRMAGDPPDLVVAPRLAHISLLEFHRAEEAIAAGEREVRRISEEIEELRAHE